MHTLIFNISYATFPFLAFLLIYTFQRRKALKKQKIITIILAILYVLSFSFIYARFIEPQIIVTHTTKINTGFTAKIAVISDIHLGVYKDEEFLEKVIDKIDNLNNLDALLIPGDFTYYPTKNQDLTELFASFKKLNIPIYGVLGNHDSEHPGPPLQKELQLALEANNVIFLHNTSAKLEAKNITILGLGDNWPGEDDITQIDKFTTHDNLILLTHNPDTTSRYTNSIPDITITGHTHGGQIRLPFIYKYAIPCQGDFDQGFYKTEHGKLFTTSGVGETGLPMRLGIPPVIDILEFN